MTESTATVETSDRKDTMATGWRPGNAMAHVSLFVEADTVFAISTQIVEHGVQRVAKDDEVTAGNYHCSVVKLGSAGVSIFAHRDDLVRLLVELSDHLEALDRADTVDRKVAAAETSK